MNHLKRISAVYLVCALALAAVGGDKAAAQGPEELSIPVGESRTLPATEVRNYSVANPGIAEVRVAPSGKLFVVVGRKLGSTTLLLLMKDGSEVTWKVNVIPPPNEGVEGELRDLLSDSTGVRVRRVGGRLFIEGGVSSEAELDRINHIASLYAGQVESLVVLGGSAAASKVNVRVDVYFVQYERSKLQRFGIGWPGTWGGAALRSNFAFNFVSNAISTATASVVNQPLPSIDMAASRGYAKVLKHATVIAANGSQASFSNGGNQNFQVNTGLAASIQKISYGAEVKVLPRFEPSSRELEVQVDVDVSDLIAPIAETPLPGQSTSTLSTKASLKLGESLVLSGIRTEAQRKNSRGLPWLHEIPVIGLLFGSDSDESSELESAIFVVPGIVEGASERSTELVQSTLREFRKFSGDLDDVNPQAPLSISRRPQVTP